MQIEIYSHRLRVLQLICDPSMSLIGSDDSALKKTEECIFHELCNYLTDTEEFTDCGLLKMVFIHASDLVSPL